MNIEAAQAEIDRLLTFIKSEEAKEKADILARQKAFVRRWEWRATIADCRFIVRIERRLIPSLVEEYKTLRLDSSSTDETNWHGMSHVITNNYCLYQIGGGNVITKVDTHEYAWDRYIEVASEEIEMLYNGLVPDRIKRD